MAAAVTESIPNLKTGSPAKRGDEMEASTHAPSNLLIRLLDTKKIRKAGMQERKASGPFSCLPKSLFFALCQATG
jgi:hypothetical protein